MCASSTLGPGFPFEICGLAFGGITSRVRIEIVESRGGGVWVTGCRFTRITVLKRPQGVLPSPLSRVMESPLFARGMSKGFLIFCQLVRRRYTVVDDR